MRALVIISLVTVFVGASKTQASLQCFELFSRDKTEENIKPFSSEGTYVHDYDIISLLPFYRRALSLHVKWAKASMKPNPVIIDAGGGTGNMSLQVKNARHDANVYLLDINPAMLNHASGKGFPVDHISTSDITNMKKPNGAVFDSGTADHIFTHSVIWALKDPGLFFKEASRVLKSDGTLAVSTVLHPTPELVKGFIDYLDHHLLIAEQSGRISKAQRDNFVESNKKLASVLNSPLSKKELIQLGDKYGFEAVDVQDAYVVQTPSGEKPFFSQVLFRKKSVQQSGLRVSLLIANGATRVRNLGLRLSEATRSEMSSIVAFMNSVRKEFGIDTTQQREVVHLDEGLDSFEKNYTSPNGNLIIVKDRVGKIVGTAAWSSAGGGNGKIEKMYLDPKLRGSGLGSRLLSIVMKEAFSRGCNHLELETLSTMTSAVKLYESVGFTQIPGRPPRGRVDRFYEFHLNQVRQAAE